MISGPMRTYRTSSPARRKAGSAPALKAGARVTEHRLQNGMRVLLAERHADPVVCSLLFYRVGARNETEREGGLSHFLEHMMFKGSRKFGKGEVDRLTTQLGGQNNAFTGYDHTAYWFEFASDRWETALDLEADRMRNLTLDPGEFDSERQVVLEELAMGLDDPWRVLAQRIEEVLFPRHPYGRPIIGYAETLKALRPADMRQYYERFYCPNNATLVVAGDVSPRKALSAIRARFGKIAPGAPFEEVDCFRPQIAPPAGEVRLQTSWDDSSRRLVMAWPVARVGTREDYVADVILTLLTSGRNSRLQRRLVLDEGLATSASGSNDARVEVGLFWLYAECSHGADPRDLEAAIDQELRRLATEKVPAAELKRAKSILFASEAYDGEAVSDVAEELGEYAVDADWDMAFDEGRRHGDISAEEVRTVAARFLTPDRRVLGWCLPAQGAEPEAVPRRASRRRKGSAARR